MTNPDSDKATPQVQPDKPSRDDTATDAPDNDGEGRIEDPELRSGQYGPNGSTPPS